MANEDKFPDQGARAGRAAANQAFDPCILRILMVIDSVLDFGDGPGGFSELIRVLQEPFNPAIHVAVETAHMEGIGPTTIPGQFRFAEHDLAPYDQIWLLAYGGDQPIPKADRQAITEFMQAGGGVFASGDHEDLGEAVGAYLPRVRSMRRWYFPRIGLRDQMAGNVPDRVDGVLVAPPVLGPKRLDTVAPREPGIPEFEDQSDDVPQRITPKMYARATLFPVFRRYRFPHPVLCGPRGVIRVLPDHPHPGRCEEPERVTKPFEIEPDEDFPGYRIEQEYPEDGFGRRPVPEIVAWSDNGPGISSKGPVEPQRFGAICVYDGQRAGVGRVQVDATWHHFLNLNLRGTSRPGDMLQNPDVHDLGFRASPEGRAVYEDIKAYFRNIAVWLSRPAFKRCVNFQMLFHASGELDVRMNLPRVGDPREADFWDLWNLGQFALDALGNFASQCQRIEAVLGFVPLPLRDPVFGALIPPPLAEPGDPKAEKRRAKTPTDPISAHVAELALNAVAGAVAFRILKEIGSGDAAAGEAAKIDDPVAFAGKDAEHAIRLTVREVRADMRSGGATLRAIEKLAG